MLSQVFYVLAHSLVKFGNAWLSLPLLLMARFGVSSMILSGLYAADTTWRFFKTKQASFWHAEYQRIAQHNIKQLILRAILGLAAMSFYFYALRIGPLGRGNLIFSLGVLWGYLFAILGGYEQPTWRGALGMGCAVFGLGLLFIIRGQDGNLTADLAALAGAICSGGVMVTIKSLRRTHSSRTIVTWFYGVGAVLLLPFFSRQNVTFTWPLIALILGIGIAGLLAQWIMTDAYKAVPGSVASSMNLLGTPMMMVSGMLFFAETLHMIEMAGAICIMTGLVAIVWPNQSVSKRRQHA